MHFDPHNNHFLARFLRVNMPTLPSLSVTLPDPRYAIKEIDKFALLEHKTGFNMLYSELNSLKRLDHPFVTALYFAFHNTQVRCELGDI